MVVDDEPSNLKLLEKLLRSQGYEVRSFPRGRMALEAAALRPPDLVLLDANMPEMTGYEMCARMKSDVRFSDVPIIFLSGVSSDEELSNAFVAGAVDFISKPFCFQEVFSRVATHLELSELRRTRRRDSQRERQSQEEAVLMRTRGLKAQLVALRRLVDLLSCSGDAIIVSDISRVITGWNRGAESLCGWPKSEVKGKVAPHHVQASSNVSLAEINEELRRTHHWEGELTYFRRDGQTVCVVSRQVLLDDALGGTVIEIAREVMDRRRLCEQTIEAHKVATVGRLAREMTHDFNNLLTIVRGYSGMLLESANLEPRFREMLAEVFSAGVKASSLNTQLSRFGRRQVGPPIHIGLNTIVSDARPVLTRLIGPAFELVVSLDNDCPAICADPGHVEQLLIALTMHACEAMPSTAALFIETGRVFVGADDCAACPAVEEGCYSLLDVSDRDADVHPEVRDRIFEPYSMTGEDTATGSGLSVVLRIAEACGGSSFGCSEQARGTTLRILFPSPAMEIEEGPSCGSPSFAGGSETLLLAEADEALRRYLNDLLTRRGYRVIPVMNGEELIEAAGRVQGPIHLLLAGVAGARTGGQYLPDIFSSLWPDVPVLMMSGRGKEVRRENGTRFLCKPFASADLLSMVRRLLDSPSLGLAIKATP
jgi:PAS domain S-box-containing protein